MALGDRSDGIKVRKLPGFRRIFPFLMRTRTESAAYHLKRLNVGPTFDWLHRINAGRQKKTSFFQVVLAASVRTLALRPEANRFVAGLRLYQRRTIDLSFVVKRELTEQASETTIKLTFDPRSTIADVSERVTGAVRATKKSRTSADEKLASVVSGGPRFLTRFIVWAARTLDYFGLLPSQLIKEDPMYASAFLANLGSIGLDAVYHHLYEWGNAPFFIVVGKRKKEPAVNDRGEVEARDVVDLKISLDERIADGVYFAKTIDLLADLIENPETLETPPEDLPDPFLA
ncbi:MAG: 2-oxo acid dehydrogenase subunit E2 [Candidatus Aminicenantes bacterium]|nr:2-oxo acid dehydrogenase subunit E2 [Candidatus Aminicenantes bacterium]